MNSKKKTKTNSRAGPAAVGSNTVVSRNDTLTSFSRFKQELEKDFQVGSGSQLMSTNQEDHSDVAVGNKLPVLPRYSQRIELNRKLTREKEIKTEATMGSPRIASPLPAIRRNITFSSIKGRRPIRPYITPKTPNAPKAPRPLRTPKSPKVAKTSKTQKVAKAPIQVPTHPIPLRRSARKRALPENTEVDQNNIGGNRDIESTAPKRLCVAVIDMSSPLTTMRNRNVRRYIFEDNESLAERSLLASQGNEIGENADITPLMACNESEENTSPIPEATTTVSEDDLTLIQLGEITSKQLNLVSVKPIVESESASVQEDSTLTTDYAAVESESSVVSESEALNVTLNRSFTNDVKYQLVPAPSAKSSSEIPCVIA